MSDGLGDLEEREIPLVDAIVIGAGPAGIYSIYRLRQAGFSVQAYEGGGGVGGTWHWCRYPGARFDSESITYSHSFSDELLSEWRWKECFAGQPESERYFNFVVDRFDLRRHIQFNTWVRSARWNPEAAEWEVRLDDGRVARARSVLTTVGVLSADYLPDFEGIADFEGDWCHTGRWPEGYPVDGRRVGIIGTGASPVQLIPEIASRVEELWVFQRTANYCVPLRNRDLLDEEYAWLAENYRRIFELWTESSNNHIHRYDPRPVARFSAEKRIEVFAQLWEEAGFKKWLAGFPEMIQPGPINEEYSAFIREWIRQRVDDPAVADLLVPRSHSFSSKRPPCQTNYYEAYNRPNVHLVDLREAPITRITRTGVETAATSYDGDSLVATGFDFITGSLDRFTAAQPAPGPGAPAGRHGRRRLHAAQRRRDSTQPVTGRTVRGVPMERIR